MTARSRPALKLVDDIKSDLQSPSTTTSQTLNLLRSALVLHLEDEDKQTLPAYQKRKPATRIDARKTVTGPPKRPATKRTFPSPIHEDTVPVAVTLDAKARRVLATEVFNITLKSLSNAASSRHKSGAGSPQQKPKILSRPPKPLKETSPNRQPKVRGGECSGKEGLQLRCTADCASIALDCLRSLQSGGHQLDAVDLRLEQGALILLDKTITLELVAQAEYQLRALYEQYWKRRKPGEPNINTSLEEKAFFNVDVESEKSAFKFATALQGYWLRVAILKGPQCVSEHMVDGMRLETIGSPPSVIIEGYKLGHIDAEACGTQLRTISLALSKLQSLSSGKTIPSKIDPACALRLATIALQIKIHSWKYLDHQLNLQKELWTPMNRHFQCYKTMTNCTNSQDIMISCVKALQKTLSKLEYNADAPQVIKNILGNPTTQTDLDASLLEQKFAKLSVEEDTFQSLLLSLDSTAVFLDAYPEQLEHTERSLEQLRISLDQQKILNRSNVTTIFQKMARIRKGLLTTSSSIDNDSADGRVSQAYLQLQIGCIRTIYTFVAFTVRCLQQPASSKPNSGKSTSEQAEENLVLSYARLIEAASLTEQFAITRTAVLSEEGMLALSRALEIADLVTSMKITSVTPRSTRSFLNGTPVRISQAFWSRYLWLTEHRQTIPDCVHALHASIDAVERRSLSERQAALLSLKYEQMATLLEESKSYSKALKMLVKAIELALEVGLLNDTVEAYLLESTENIWTNTKSVFYRFGINLASYARLSVGDRILDKANLWMFDVTTQPSLHRFVMLERQLVSILKSSVDVSKEQLKNAMDHIIGLLRQSNLKQHQLQFVSQMLFLLERDQRWDARDFFTNELIRSTTSLSEHASDAESTAILAMWAHMISTQWTLIKGELDEDLLKNVATEYKNSFETIADSRAFHNSISSARILASQLTTLADFAGVLGNDRIQLELLMMLRMLQQHDQLQSTDQRVSCLVQVGVLQNRLGSTALAGKAFAQSEKLLAQGQICSQHRIAWALGYAEYLLNVRNIIKSQELLHVAQQDHSTLQNDYEGHLRAKLATKTSLCQAAYLSSKLAFRQGQLSEALCFAKQAARLSIGLWNNIEKTLQAPVSDRTEDSIQTNTNGLSNINPSGDQSKPRAAQGARFWSIISLHRQVLRHIAFLFSHAGLYEDSLFYSQHVWRVCQVTGGRSLSASVRTDLALLHANAAQKEKAMQLLACEESIGSQELLSSGSVGILLGAGEVCALLGKRDEAGQWLQRVYDLQLPWLRSNVSRPATPELPRHVNPRKKDVKPRTVGAGKRATKTAIFMLPVEAAELNTPLTAFQLEVIARVLALENTIHRFEQSDSRQVNVKQSFPISATRNPLIAVSTALMLLRQALRSLTTDPASNALAETAVAIPVSYRSTRKSGQMSLLDDTALSTPKMSKSPKASKLVDTTFDIDISTADGSELLRKAFEMLEAIDASKHQLLPSSTVSVMHKALCQITLMSSALSVPLSYSTLAMVLQSLVPKEVARSREKHAILAETSAITPEELQKWPQLSRQLHERPSEHVTAHLKELLNVLPSSWTIVSLGLSHDQKELLLSKIETGTSPFLMRVPLGRPDIDDSEAHDFTFEYAKAELVEIISATTASTHDERGQGDKPTRAKWFAEREALDHRLEALLVNIENIWLGGFRGLFSSQYIDQTLLSRFGQSLSNALDAHLPSRQKASKTITRVDLHAHVLELFTTLPFHESPELEDSITDLLYFVTDILQLNGEPNAYDEIDFDALLVDVLDALRAYHATNTPPREQPTRHTILIIDKELEAFPWESLPILQHRPVSRVPSLGAIKDRLDLIRPQSPTSDALTIPTDKGAYILNPSSDLPSTQATFQSLLSSHLTSYTPLIAQPPTPQQFESLLTTHPLLLYFGHGSGAQYIPKRRIRNLPKCAVTWLLGCSSAKMTEAGGFESYGMPNAYMHGGSAAVVGTLWDVTDRDLDRAGVRGLSAWGLLEEREVEEDGKRKMMNGAAGSKARKGKLKGKGGRRDEEAEGEWDVKGVWEKYKNTTKKERRGKVALDEAISMAREACWLRYLNGAALVVYGVPVVLAQD